MEKTIRDTQLKLLEVFSGLKTPFALAGGTALELYYLNHRFSKDLDFFSKKYSIDDADAVVKEFNKQLTSKFKPNEEFTVPGKARVKMYLTEIKRGIPLKLDFVEDVIVENPKIKVSKGVRVYDIKDIYLQKINAIAGTYESIDETGRETPSGRDEPRDIFDVYCISKKIQPLRIFMAKLSDSQKRRMVQWYRSYSRHEVKLGLLDLDIYDKKFDSGEMIRYIDNEIKKFIEEETK